MRVTAILVPVLAIANLIFFGLTLIARKTQVPKHYSYVGDDFPREAPIPPLKTVKMDFEESLRFRSTLSANGSIKDWAYIVPPGLGYLRTGPNRRIFAVAMYHQLHCLLQISYAMAHNLGANAHLHHCIDYIRQNILCAADATLEPEDFTQRNLTVNRIGMTRSCRDWTTVYDFVEENHREWLKYKEMHVEDFVS